MIDFITLDQLGLVEAAMIFLVALSSLLSSYRLFKGPTVLDRLLSYSSLSAKIVIFLVLESIFNRRVAYLNLAFIYAILSFLGIAVVARFVEREEG